jgi:DNA polymerase-4
MDRVILHSDLNAFYANVECFHNPRLKDKPVAVCGDKELRHGIVLAKNQLAKQYGVKTGDTIWEAKKKCGDIVIITANFPLYLRFSEMARKIYERYTDIVESFGIDECWLDVTSSTKLFGSGEEIANKIREDMKRELGCTVSIGISWNKIFAKLGSDIKKPDAQTLITKENYKDVVFKLPAEDLLFVGKATKEKLNKYSIRTIGGIANANLGFLKSTFGKWGEYLWKFANGYDDAPVVRNEHKDLVKSVGNSTTALRDLETVDDVKMIITVLAESVAARLREQWLKGQVVYLSITDNTFLSWGKQIKINEPTFNSLDIIKTAENLFKNHYHFNKPIRRIGVSVSHLTSASTAHQTNIFFDETKRERADNLELSIDSLKKRFGNKAISRATLLLDPELTDLNPKADHTIHPLSYL